MFADHCEDLAYDIAFWSQNLDNPACPLDEVGALTQELCEKLRAIAIMLLLSQGKVDRFHHNLIRSGRTRCAFLSRAHQAQDVTQHEFVSGIPEPVFDAIAAGDMNLADHILSLSPEAFRPGHEYEDDHWLCKVLAALAREADAAAEGAAHVAALIERLADAAGDDAPRVQLSRALLSRDEAAFAQGFDALLRARQQEIDAEIERGEMEEPLVMAQREVFVEGLAWLQLAQRRGIATEADYLFCPALARRPMVAPYPGP